MGRRAAARGKAMVPLKAIWVLFFVFFNFAGAVEFARMAAESEPSVSAKTLADGFGELRILSLGNQPVQMVLETFRQKYFEAFGKGWLLRARINDKDYELGLGGAKASEEGWLEYELAPREDQKEDFAAERFGFGFNDVELRLDGTGGVAPGYLKIKSALDAKGAGWVYDLAANPYARGGLWAASLALLAALCALSWAWSKLGEGEPEGG